MKKKLLFLVNVDWFFLSHRLPIALKALDDGFEVHVATSITRSQSDLQSHGFIVHPLKMSRGGTSLFAEIRCFIGIVKVLRDIEPDLIHLVTIKPVLYGGIAARLLGIPAVVSAVSGLGFLFVDRSGILPWFKRQIALFLYSRATGHSNQRIVFQNSADRNALSIANKNIIEKAVLVRGSGVDLTQYQFVEEPNGVPVITMACRLLKDKGVFEFIEAARLIKKKGVKARFCLVGDIDPENPESVTNEYIAEWKTEGVVDILGFQSNIAKLFADSHIIVLPSYREGLPKVLIEAAACGRAVVTTDVPGCRDAIEENVSGFLVPPRDALALADAIEKLIENSDLRKKMGKEGRQLAEREFGIEKVVQAHMRVYDELLSNVNIAELSG